MATPAQIAANRRNALRSTGPRTVAGKARSSRNASRQGRAFEPDPADVRATYFAITGKDLSAEADIPDPVSFRLAVAEAWLSLARRTEQSVLAEGDDVRRLLPEVDAVTAVLDEQAVGLDPRSVRIFQEGTALLLKLRSVGAKTAKQTFRRLLRELREAEREHGNALSAWIDRAG